MKKVFYIGKSLELVNGAVKFTPFIREGGKVFYTSDRKEAETLLEKLLQEDPKGGWFLLVREEPKVDINVHFDEEQK